MVENTKEALLERRARREERRAKQREENVHRAAKMHQARMNFEAEPTLLKPKKSRLPKYNIGCSGWYYWHWRGGFYPAEMKTAEWFNHYADNFETVELNAPFYSWPTIATVKSWLRQTGDKEFVYTVKASELITHTKRFVGTKTLVLDFNLIADLLAERMGCFLYQLPPSYHYTPARLKQIVAQLDPARRNVVEFRHASWWNEKTYDAFRAANIIFCSCSGPKLPDELIKTADEIYVRFHGKDKWYLHDYSDAELKEWAARIKKSKAKRVWAYFNNDRDGHAIRNAQTLLNMLEAK